MDGFADGVTFIPKSILHYLLDKGSNSNLVFLNFFSDFQDIPNKSSKHERNNIISGDSLHLELRLWANIWVIKHSGQGAALQE